MVSKICSTLIIALSLNGCARPISIPVEKVKFRHQQNHFILGTREINIAVQKVYYYPSKEKYLVIGNVIEENGDKIKFRMDIRHDSDTTYLRHTNQDGSFKIMLEKNDTVRFSEITSQFVDLFIR